MPISSTPLEKIVVFSRTTRRNGERTNGMLIAGTEIIKKHNQLNKLKYDDSERIFYGNDY